MNINMQKQNKLVLVGNPNVGKSVVFQSLTDSYAEVSNYPGTTVEITSGTFGSLVVSDTPGIFSLSNFNEEEQVTLDTLTACDLILNVVDATHLSRDFFLTLQLISTGKPMLMAMNLMDQVRKTHLCIDLAGLSAALGIPIYSISAKTGEGMAALKTALCAAPSPENSKSSPAFAESDLSLRQKADELAARYVMQTGHPKPSFSKSFGRALFHPLVGFPFLLLLFCTLFFFIGNVLSQRVVGFTQGFLMEDCYLPLIRSLTTGLFHPDSLLGVLFLGEYGVLTMVPVYLFGLLLPLIIGFYLCLSLLEDSGLLPRIAVLCDRLFTGFGLNGKAIIPMLLGFGCVTMALITTRILGSKRERLIASVLLCVAIPCSAQFSIILVIAATLPPAYFLLYMAILFFLFCLVGRLLHRFLPGTGTDLFLTLPPLRLPGLKNSLQKTAMKSKHFLMDAGPMFVVGSILISLLSYKNGFVSLHHFLLPLMERILHLPPEAATLFLLSLIKRDLGAAYLYSMVGRGLLSFPQLTVALTVITLFVPCFASMAILCKERGARAACLIWIGSFLLAFLVGGLLATFLSLL